jgi:PAS domain S-box-containing protein
MVNPINSSVHHPFMEMGEMFQRMIEHAPIGTLLIDSEGKILHINPKTENIFGYGLSDLLGQPMEILLPERYRGGHGALRTGFMTTPIARPMGAGRHLFAQHKDGHEIPVEIGLVPMPTAKGMTVLATIVDVTAQQEANRSMAHLAAVVEASGDAIITLSENDVILTWNRGAESIYGYNTQEVIGKNVAFLVPPDRAEEFRLIRERMRRGESIQQVQTVRIRKGGYPISVLLSINPMKNTAGQNTGYATITHDITENRRLEQDLLHAIEIEQKRIGQDLHDTLGQQLLAVSFLCNVLRKKLVAKGQPEASEAQHIEDLLNQTKINLRKLTHNLHTVDLEQRGLGASLKEMVAQVQETSAIHCRFEGDENIAILDRVLAENLYRLAQEALTNAVKHSFAQEITVSLEKVANRITLTIRDSGVGLPERMRPEAGLGLRTMRFRANVIGGALDVSRHPEGGTIVRCSVLVA